METYQTHLKKLYRPGQAEKDPPGFTCLNHNEAPFDGSRLFPYQCKNLNLYPDPFPLYCKLASHLSVDRENLLLTTGSEQALRFAFDTYIPLGGTVAYPWPTYGMVEVYAHYRMADVTQLHYTETRRLSEQSIFDCLNHRLDLFYLANPDNPTGSCLTLTQIENIAQACDDNHKTMFLLDEAYHGYAKLPTLKLLDKYRQLLIVRSFSKDWGLAGLRVGYVIGSKSNIDLLRKQKPMNEVNSISVDICLKALDFPEIVTANANQVKKWKRHFKAKQSETLTYIPSEGNFIILQSNDCQNHYNKLLHNNILTRTFDHPSLLNCIRFSVAEDNVMHKLDAILYDQ